MKGYRSASGDIQVFRPEENMKRFNKSAYRMCMPEVPEELFLGGLRTLLKLDQAWVPAKEGCSLYIRPFMFATDEYVGVTPSNTFVPRKVVLVLQKMRVIMVDHYFQRRTQ
jgi:branched-chain amino acid aminotransferase